MIRHYILDQNHNTVIETDMLTWARWMDGRERIVAQETVGRFWVSTVCIGLDHDFSMMAMIHEYGEGVPLGFYQPVVFETMVFYDEREELEIGGKPMKVRKEAHYQTRCRTWEEALAKHARAVKIMARYERMLVHREGVLARLEGSL